ncbi:MAG TPA: chemotaxis protein CheX [Candidatus Acidoferrales bacterium]|nr:chemotaxis protein CheX [Candidatus Acidoferrales bacterium]
MKMNLIQPFISAADCVLATALNGPTKIGDLTMEQTEYRRRGCAVRVLIHGEIEGRIILDMAPDTAILVARALGGEEIEASGQIVSETIFELANMIIGNAVTLLNDRGYKFKVLPPERYEDSEAGSNRTDTEETAIYFDTACGSIFLDICMRYNLRPRPERIPALGD